MLKGLLAAAVVLGSLYTGAAEYIIKQKPGHMLSLNSVKGVQVTNMHTKAGLYKVEINTLNVIRVLAQLYKLEGVEYIVKDFKLKAFRTPPTMAELKEQWAITKVNAEKAWELASAKDQRNVVIAVIDTGIDYNHESLRPNMVPGYDFRDKDADPMDDTGSANPGHGTHCAGIIGATGLIEGGVTGIAPGVSIMPIRFLGADGGGDLMAGIKSIDYAIEKGVQVISASWGAAVPRSQATPLIEAVQRASDAGIIFVSAAANDGKNNDKRDMFPANAEFDNTIAVAASGPNDEKPNWSNYGRKMVHLAAPGLNIMSTLPGNKYENLSGTSMATPLVAGLVGLLKSRNPELTGAQARALLQITGAQVGIETACNCRIDAGAAMEKMINKEMYLVPAAKTIAPNESVRFSAVNSAGTVAYKVSNPEVATIDENGVLTAKANGAIKVTAADDSGVQATSLEILISDKANEAPGGQCPIGNPLICEVACRFVPSLPFCN